MKKKIFSVALAGVLAAGVITGSLVAANAAGVGVLPEYTPADDVETRLTYFALPGGWVNEYTKAEGNPTGIYWWSATDSPDDNPAAGGHGWPGYKLSKVEDGDVENLYSTPVPTDVATVIYCNYIDGGMDIKDPAFDAAMQTADLAFELWDEGASPYYPQYFWDYVIDLDGDFSVFGDYADNFADDPKWGPSYTADNMVCVCDLRPETMTISYEMVPEGKAKYAAEFYFYYGDGNYGIWPTVELAAEQEGLTIDEKGNVDKNNLPEGCSLDQWGNVIREVDGETYVIVGNFTGKYWEDNDPVTTTSGSEDATTAPSSGEDTTTAPSGDTEGTTVSDEDTTTTVEETTTIPDPDGNIQGTTGAPSTPSQANPTTPANGAIATGQISFVVIAIILMFAGLGVFYFVRKRTEK